MGETILIFAITIALGLLLGRVKVGGVSIGATWILFVGIILSHFGLRVNPTALAFVKDFGLILFVFSIGLQVGPGFFHSFKKGGVSMNLMALLLVSLAVVVTLAIHFITGERLDTMVGVMSGAVTNTPGLGAAQQTLQDILVAEEQTPAAAAAASSGLASAYAVAYPLGVLLVIGLLMFFKSFFKVDLKKEQQLIEAEDDTAASSARRMHCEVENPAIFGKTIKEVLTGEHSEFVISRVMKGDGILVPTPDTVLEQGDKVLLVTSQKAVDHLRIIFGEEIPMHKSDWDKMDSKVVSRRLSITKSDLTGQTLGSLHIRAAYNVTVTRIHRAGVELVARPGLVLQMGDNIQVVGAAEDIARVAKLVGNKPETLSHPNLVPIFAGIALGILFGMLPIHFPGIPQPVRLGLAGGPLIIAILLGHFGPKLHITTYTTLSANMMLREVGIVLFMAAVGLGAGENFVASLLGGGWWWILYGALITFIPVLITGLVARYALHFNFYQICGLLSGGTTDPAALAFSQGAYGTDYTAVNYATVYPLTMFLRVLAAQLLVLVAFA